MRKEVLRGCQTYAIYGQVNGLDSRQHWTTWAYMYSVSSTRYSYSLVYQGSITDKQADKITRDNTLEKNTRWSEVLQIYSSDVILCGWLGLKHQLTNLQI